MEGVGPGIKRDLLLIINGWTLDLLTCEVWVLNSLNKLKPFNIRQFILFYEYTDMHLHQQLMGIWVGHLVTLEGKLQCLDIGIGMDDSRLPKIVFKWDSW